MRVSYLVPGLAPFVLAACVSIPPAATQPDGDGGGVPGCEDTDGDGYVAEGCDERTPTDCAEGNAEIHPGAYDDCNTPADEDCVQGPAECAASILPVTESISGSLVQVETAHLVAAFDGDAGHTMVSLEPTTETGNLLHTGESFERWIGTHMFRSRASYQARDETFERPVAGRAARQYQIAWEVESASDSERLSGVSTYTFFPDGRIHRAEDLMAQGQSKPFTTYIALDPEMFTHRLNPGALSDPGLAVLELSELLSQHGGLHQPLGDSQTATSGRGCAYHEEDGFGLSYAWRAYVGVANLRTRMPQSVLDKNPSAHQFAMTLDWEPDGNSSYDGPYRGAFLLQPGLYPVKEQPCSSLVAAATAFLEPPMLLGNRGVTTEEGDPNGDAYVDDGGFYAVDAAGGGSLGLAWDPSRPSGPTFSLRVSGAPNDFDPVVFAGTSETALSHGVDYLMHREPDGTLWFYFARPVSADGINIVFP